MRFSFHCIANFGAFSRRDSRRRVINFTKVRTITRNSISSSQQFTTGRYTTEASKNPSKFAQALRQENLESSRSSSSPTPSAAAAVLDRALETDRVMAPQRRGTKGGAKPPNVDRNGKPVTTEPKPSASILLFSPANEVLLLHRVKTSSSFASAHVFPGGNLDSQQDGPIPGADSLDRHVDSEVYRIGAIRECFEESGILLARDSAGNMLTIDDAEKKEARAAIHSNNVNFGEWVKSKGGVIDTANLIPFTRWVTPIGVPRRFTTQMYVYFWPLTNGNTSKSLLGGEAEQEILVPTSDGGKEHTEAIFRSCKEWTEMGSKGEIILFPPQYYLMWQLSRFLTSATTDAAELEKQREEAKIFLTGGGANGVPWAEKCISPQTLGLWNGRAVLDLSKPGPELKGCGREGETGEVVLVKFSKAGPREVEVRGRKEVLEAMRVEATAKEGAKL